MATDLYAKGVTPIVGSSQLLLEVKTLCIALAPSFKKIISLAASI